MGDRGAQGPSSVTCLYLYSSASPVIENGQLECPQGYKRLNLTHCQGKGNPGPGLGLGRGGDEGLRMPGHSPPMSPDRRSGVTECSLLGTAKPQLRGVVGAAGSRVLRKLGR